MSKDAAQMQARFLGVALIVILVVALVAAANSTPVRSRTGIAFATLLPKASATFTPTLTPTRTPTPTPSPTATPTQTPSPSPSPSPNATQSPHTSPTATATASQTPTPTQTATPTATPTPLPTPDGVDRELILPILMYHYISQPPIDADDYRLNLSVPPDDFSAHLAYLRSEGYTSLDLYHLLDHLTWGRSLPAKPIIITIDDGYRDAYENAFPLLKEYGFTATFFILTDPIDQNSDRYLTWDQVAEMAAAGMGFEPHSKTHPDLRGQDHDYLVWEILGAAQTLEVHLGRYPRFFAYPSGWYDQSTIDFLKEINFWGAVTTWHGVTHTWEDRFEILRIRVSGGDTVAVLTELIGETP